MPKEGPDQPIDKVIRTAEPVFLSLRKSLITSAALSVTVNITYPPSTNGYFSINILCNLVIFNELSIIFFPNRSNALSFPAFEPGNLFPLTLNIDLAYYPNTATDNITS
jgi:hypothetical protein